MDIKLANLLLGKHYNLKIADFGLSASSEKAYSYGRGTQNYRAPELISSKCEDPKANDIYAAGIVLFCLATAHMPYLEKKTVKGYDLHSMLMNGDLKDYWKAFTECCNQKVAISAGLKQLFEGMVHAEPSKRLSIEEIKSHSWFKKEVYTREQLKHVMRDKVKPLNETSPQK
mmetsp:Transcript_30728/g.27929  ORF Transcript_30728/g.27929 Transcript_30728/m.27929 type:complete len:172 (+) Transcript_30728:531-1046(+)|eukprot:CAMPEP_0114575310 /NCGR_PEP_ID=MMETSP0125-20121206/191_1 /TAXON_ID=485358 ORGANISM="Aristerostoma sp., Strain ATCC 50986" /NCGR_SAMPLE_ID=MMETSP0125 /ASSEMBLY_ACC=CAM_ASM_000245 /LENGTH=171 /DNA_ID=CAMNT_0001762935 /DNA_START=530 /DNA_END=1045 /DNA_ORIENTATION=-